MNALPEYHLQTLSDISNRTIYQAKRLSLTALSTDLTHINEVNSFSKKDLSSSSPVYELNEPKQGINENWIFSEPQRRKRCRDEFSLSENKKSKYNNGPVTKMITELYDPDTQVTLGFRCFREIEIIKDKNISKKIIQNECDDDCPTDDIQIEACIDFMSKEIEQALNNYNIW